jgi:hypothetical protein
MHSEKQISLPPLRQCRANRKAMPWWTKVLGALQSNFQREKIKKNNVPGIGFSTIKAKPNNRGIKLPCIYSIVLLQLFLCKT